MINRRILFIGISCIFCIGIFCISEKNPFTDPANARAVLAHSSIKNRDTIAIFSSETLFVKVAVRELVDSFSVMCPSNIRGDTMTYHGENGMILAPGPYACIVSCSDTGWVTISLKTFRKNSEDIIQEFSVYRRSPLNQAGIKGNYGDSLLLSTNAVGDTNVTYHWSFGKDFVITSHLPKIKAPVFLDTLGTIGKLWVTSIEKNRMSPKVYFSYLLKDSAGPVISFSGAESVIQDTILTGDSSFMFTANIVDHAQIATTCLATINNTKFDVARDSTYIKMIMKMDTVTTSIPVVIKAYDKLNNKSEKVFYVKYDKSKKPLNTYSLFFTNPSKENAIVSMDNYTVLGGFRTNGTFFAIIKLVVNGDTLKQIDTTKGQDIQEGTWNITCKLVPKFNSIKAIAYSLSMQELTNISTTVYYDPTAIDTIEPRIYEISDNGRMFNPSLWVQDSLATIKIIAYDEGSGINHVYSNNKEITTDQKVIWNTSVVLLHKKEGNVFIIKVEDLKGNVHSDTVTEYYNHPIVISKKATFPKQLNAAQTYSSTMNFYDPDNDEIAVHIKSDSSNISASSDGSIIWKPTRAEVGTHRAPIVTLFDGYEYVSDTLKGYEIVDSLPPSVRFLSTANKYPVYLEANKDSFSTVLQIVKGTGKRPLAFSVLALDSGTLFNVKDSVLLWRPNESDTGSKSFAFVVRDTFYQADTIFHTFIVVPQNRPCSLFVAIADTLSKLKFRDLDLSNATKPETLSFVVSDPDLPVIDHQTVSIEFLGKKTTIAIDSSKKFNVILDPKQSENQLKDTLIVKVVDKAGHADSLTYYIKYNSIKFFGKIYISTRSSGVGLTQNVVAFPLLVRLDKQFFPFSQTHANGSDIRFFKSNGASIPYEIERWDSLPGKAVVWVKIDTIYPDNDSQYIKMTWGNKALKDNSDGAAVFDSVNGYVGVWHMSDNTLNQNKNAVSTKYYALPNGNPNPNTQILFGNGIIGDADSLNANRYVSMSNVIVGAQITVSAWVYPTSYSNSAKIIYKSASFFGGASYPAVSLQTTGSSPSPLEFHVALNNAKDTLATSSVELNVNTWTHIAGTFDGSRVQLYVNGNRIGNVSFTGSLPGNAGTWSIGGQDMPQQGFFAGMVDEPRICRIAQSADFMRLSYENQRIGSQLLDMK